MGTELQSPPETLYATNVRRIAELEDALASITRERDAMREALDGFGDDYQTSERHHPNHVLIPTLVFERVRATALVNGEGGEMALRTITLTVDQAEFFDHVSQHGLINSTCPIGSRVIACLLGGVDWREAMGLGVYGVSVIEEAPATPTKETSNG